MGDDNDEEMVRLAFRTLDKDGSGEISTDEFKHLMTHIGRHSTLQHHNITTSDDALVFNIVFDCLMETNFLYIVHLSYKQKSFATRQILQSGL